MRQAKRDALSLDGPQIRKHQKLEEGEDAETEKVSNGVWCTVLSVTSLVYG